MYHIELLEHGRIIHTIETPNNSFVYDRALQQGVKYEVNVKAKTDKWGEAIATSFLYHTPGKYLIIYLVIVLSTTNTRKKILE